MCMEDNRRRIRISFNPDNEEEAEILAYFDNSDESAQVLIKRALRDYIKPAEIKSVEATEVVENPVSQETPEPLKENQINYNVIREEPHDKKEKQRWYIFRRKSRKEDANESEDRRYIVEEKSINDYESLEKYAIEKKLEPEIMTMMALALDWGVDYGTIISMIENNLSPHQMRAVIDLVMAKKKTSKPKNPPSSAVNKASSGKTDKKSDNKTDSKSDNKPDNKVDGNKDPLAVELKGVTEDI